jgi:hypothetical protein
MLGPTESGHITYLPTYVHLLLLEIWFGFPSWMGFYNIPTYLPTSTYVHLPTYTYLTGYLGNYIVYASVGF